MDPPVVPGALLRFSCNELEQTWRRDFNRTFLGIDLGWTIATFITFTRYSMSWPNGGLATFSWYIICGVLPTAALLFLQLRHKAIYLRHRIPIVLTVRGIRILGVLVALGPAQNEIWPPSHPTSCTPTLLASQANKVFYLVAQTVGFQVPLVYQVWVAVAGAVVALFFVPQRCMSFIAVSPAVGHCSLKSMAKLSWLNKLWVMSLSNPESYGANLMPWQVCAQLQALLIIVVGTAAPIIIYASIEAAWRLEWACSKGGTPLIPSLWHRLAFDIILILSAAAIAYNFVTLYV